MSKTIVGLFQDTAEAQRVKQILVDGGYTADQVKIVATDHDEDLVTASKSTSYEKGAGIGEKVSSLFHGLSGGDTHAHTHYATGVNEGGALLTVAADDSDAEEVAALLQQHGARDIESGQGSTTENQRQLVGSDSETATGETAIPIVEEQLVVGKRNVDRGGVRVYSHVVERPVEAEVTLRDEQINVQRRPVNRVATAADFEMGNRSAFELHATGEEAVIGKNSRVVEEVVVGKQASSHSEAIHDTVRKTEVEVEQIAGGLESTTKR